MLDDDLQLLTPEDTAEIFRCSVPHVYRLLRRGELRGVRRAPTAAWRVPAIHVAAYLALPVPGAARSPRDVLDLGEVVRLSRYGERTVRADLAAGRLQGCFVGRRWLVSVAAYRSWAGL
ncbi:MAG: helix-turn-helix domain-containing protein [Alphaproteobacteria bacterium]